MASGNNISIPEPLLAEVKSAAKAEHARLDEFWLMP